MHVSFDDKCRDAMVEYVLDGAEKVNKVQVGPDVLGTATASWYFRNNWSPFHVLVLWTAL